MNSIAKIYIKQNNKRIDRLYDYLIPENDTDCYKIGIRVVVPFGIWNKNHEGFIYDIICLNNYECNYSIKSIVKPIDSAPMLSEYQLKLANWMKNNYHCSFYEVLNLFISSVKVKKEKIYLQNEDELIDSFIKDKYFSENRRVDASKICMEDISLIEKNLKNKAMVYNYDYRLTPHKKMKQTYFSLIENYNAKHIPGNAKVQRHIVDMLKTSDLSESEIKNVIPNYRSALLALKKKKIIKSYSVNLLDLEKNDIYINNEKKLSVDQKNALEEINNSKNNKHLVFGKTGSGKTELYFKLIEAELKKNKQSLLLIPEIALTPQILEEVYKRFGKNVAVFHSRLTKEERYFQWMNIRENNIKIIIGPRSILFLPVENIGLIVIDEEHETSYKSGQNPKYHAVKIAEKISEFTNCKLILGSATPSVISYYKSEKNFYNLVKMDNRINQLPMPAITLVDMKAEVIQGNYSVISNHLKKELIDTYRKNEQSILFLNRKGYANYVFCIECGYTFKCPNCDVSLKYHKHSNKLKCHYCGYIEPLTDACPVCQNDKFKLQGIGTEQLCEIIEEILPEAKILRLDSEIAQSYTELEKILNKFKNNMADVLVGTQIIAKGLDCTNVTLTGIVSGDASMNMNDYMGNERTFQLITQAAGRAGRNEKVGKVIIQTYHTDNPIYRKIINYDYEGFYRDEIIFRKNYEYPPNNNLILIMIFGKRETEVIIDSEKLYKMISAVIAKLKIDKIIDIYNVTDAQIYKIEKNFRRQIILKTSNIKAFHKLIEIMISNGAYEIINSKISIDINPIFS
jgi:primosomal protein N' (replication factor Y)